MKNILLLIALTISLSLSSQVTGYNGKRLIINTDLMDFALGNFGAGVGAEYAFFRKVSFTFDYGFTRKIKKYPDIKAFNTIYKQHGFRAGFKWYINKGFNAPHGAYYIAKIGYSSISGNGVTLSTNDLGKEVYRTYEEKNIRAFYGEMGLGKQWIIKSWVTIDIAAGFNVGGTIPSDHSYSEEFGPNILSVAQFGGSVGYTLGLWGNLKIGILLPI